MSVHAKYMTRRGIVLSLPLTVGLLVVLSIVAFVQLSRSGQTLEEAAWDAGGAACEEAANSCIEEAAWRLQRAFTDPAHPLYWHLRRELVRGHRPFLDISSDLEPRHLKDRIADGHLPPLFRKMRVEHFRAVLHVPARGAHADQLVDFDCGVSLDLATHRVYRRACERRRYGVVHVSTPKPFDQLTLAIAQHGFLETLPRTRDRFRGRVLAANALSERLGWMRQAASGRPARGLTGEVSGDGAQVTLSFAPPFLPAARPPPMPPFLRRILQERVDERRRQDRNFDDFMSGLTADQRAWEEWRMVLDRAEAHAKLELARQDLPRVSAVWPPLPMELIGTEAPPGDAVVFSQAADVDLAEFDYEARFRDAERQHGPVLERAMQEVNALWVSLVTPQATPLSTVQVRELHLRLAALSRRMRPPLTALVHELERLVAHAALHTRTGFSNGALQAYLTRSSHRLRAFGLHVEEQADLKAALADYPVFNGHLSLSGHTPLELDWPRFAGKVVISVRTGRGEVAERLTLKALRRTDPRADLAVVDAPQLALAGDVDAALVAGERFSTRQAVNITGSLLINRLYPLVDRAPDEELRGHVLRDPLVSSGPLVERRTTAEEPAGLSLDHLVITLCPRGVQRTVRRAPPAGEVP